LEVWFYDVQMAVQARLGVWCWLFTCLANGVEQFMGLPYHLHFNYLSLASGGETRAEL